MDPYEKLVGSNGLVMRVFSRDLRAAGLVLEGTRSVAISGNLFSSLLPKAVELRGADSKQILFGDNLLVDSPSDHERLQQSVKGSVLIAP